VASVAALEHLRKRVKNLQKSFDESAENSAIIPAQPRRRCDRISSRGLNFFRNFASKFSPL
jgi:hypothetical protein